MNDHKLQLENEPYPVQQQSLSDDSEHERDTIKKEPEEECAPEKERSSDILKKYLECLKSPAGKRRRCISQELG